MQDFVHLHVHSEYSLLDGYSKTRDLCARAVELGMDSLALTDHGVMYGAMEFYTTARKAGIKPIIGVEAYMAIGKHNDRTPQGKGYYHTLLLAQNEIGYRNLVKLTTRAHLDGFYYKPRIDHDLLEEHHEGLIVTSSCLSGEINRHLTKKQKEKAREIAAWHRDLLGPERYFLELQLHPGVPELVELNDELVRIGTELGIPLVATNDAHFVRKEDAEAHRLIRAMGFNTTLADLCAKEPNLDDSYHLMTGAEMWEIFKRYGPAPLENTRRIADQCNLDLTFGRVQLPDFELPAGHNPTTYLKLVSEEGLVRRFNSQVPEGYPERLAYELDVINQTGFPLYMLIVWDFIKVARERNIPCLPRGSAGASLVLYALGITDVDPIANKLLFERFLSPERLEMPDIDVDFADSRRHEILDYVANKYGRDKTAQIITYGTLGAKAALRDIGRVMGIALSEVDRVAKLIPTLPVGTTIKQALERVPELKQLYDSDPQLHQLIVWAQSIEGRMRNVGTHACGLVVSAEPLVTMVPLQRTKDENSLMAAYEGPTLAYLGLLKMDMLGLTNLSVVANALDYIAKVENRLFTLADIPIDDAKTFEGLSRGETTNVFQFEGAGMTRYIRELKPTHVGDLYAMVALYRPGPLEQIPLYIYNKNNPKAIKYLHPILKPILEDTYGVIVYQEQIMQLLQAIAGYTLGEAYIVLKAIGKKNRELMAKEEPRFKSGCLKNGLTQQQADLLWDLIQPFAGYSFNRPHSTLYGLLSYQTAYLKFNYPTEYMAAVLSAAANDIESVAKGVAECGRLGVAVLRPDINTSEMGFTIEQVPEPLPPSVIYDRGVRFGMGAIKTLGEGPVEAILRARVANGPFLSIEDFCARVERQALNKRVTEALIKSGAMDSLPGTRHQKLAILERALSSGIDAQRAREAGQGSLFDLLGQEAAAAASANVSSIPLPSFDDKDRDNQRRELLVWEKELLGMYMSEQPILQALQSAAPDPGRITLPQITQAHVGQTVRLIGMLTATKRLQTKKGDAMLVGEVEDLEGTIKFVAFPKAYEKYRDLLIDELIVNFTAKVDFRDATVQLICEHVTLFEASVIVESQAGMGIIPALVRPVIADLPDDTWMAFADEGAPLPPEPGVEEWVIDEEYAMPTIVATAVHERSIPAANAGPGSVQQHGLTTAVDLASTGPARSNGAHPQSNGAGVQANGAGAQSNGSSNHPPASPAANPPAVSIVPRPRRRVTLPEAQNETQPAQAAPMAGPRFHLHIYLPRTGDFDADIRRMREIDRVMRAHEGDQAVTLYLPNAVGQVMLEPSHRVAPVEPLIQTLAAMLGTENVVLERLDLAA